MMNTNHKKDALEDESESTLFRNSVAHNKDAIELRNKIFNLVSDEIFKSTPRNVVGTSRKQMVPTWAISAAALACAKVAGRAVGVALVIFARDTGKNLKAASKDELETMIAWLMDELVGEAVDETLAVIDERLRELPK